MAHEEKQKEMKYLKLSFEERQALALESISKDISTIVFAMIDIAKVQKSGK
jgi:hypothetical protein